MNRALGEMESLPLTRVAIPGWTTSEVQTAIRLFGEGLSFGQISKQIPGKTRNAVLSKLSRMGYDRGQSKNTPHGIHSAPSPAQQWPRAGAQARQEPRSVAKATPAGAPDPESAPVTLLEAKRGHCRWPVGDPLTEEFRVCGAKRQDDYPYCEGHCKKAYQPMQHRDGQAERRPLRRGQTGMWQR